MSGVIETFCLLRSRILRFRKFKNHICLYYGLSITFYDTYYLFDFLFYLGLRVIKCVCTDSAGSNNIIIFSVLKRLTNDEN